MCVCVCVCVCVSVFVCVFFFFLFFFFCCCCCFCFRFFFLFFAEFEYLMFHDNTVKISEKIEQVELVENQLHLPYRFLHNLHSFLLWEKVENI